jgi:hypothetical protein
MRALTLTEPWATLMALHEKTVETRSWKLPAGIIGEEVAIHAAKGFPKWAKETCDEEPYRTALTLPGGIWSYPEKNCGHVLCIVKFIGYRRTEDVRGQLSEKQLAFGDYAEGRFAWFTEFVERLPRPVAAIGHLGFWEWFGEQ